MKVRMNLRHFMAQHTRTQSNGSQSLIPGSVRFRKKRTLWQCFCMTTHRTGLIVFHQRRRTLRYSWRRHSNSVSKTLIYWSGRKWASSMWNRSQGAAESEATDLTQGDQTVTINCVVPVVLSLKSRLEAYLLSAGSFTTLTNTLLQSLCSRFARLFQMLSISI